MALLHAFPKHCNIIFFRQQAISAVNILFCCSQHDSGEILTDVELSWAMFFGVNALWRSRSGWGEFSRQRSLLWPPCCALSGVNAMLRKVAGAAAAKPHVEIRQDGERFYIKTSTSVRTTEINFHIGEEFDEETVDGRKCKVHHEKLT